MNDRVLVLDGVHNFRDYGGYAVAGGGRLKRGVLWRSGQHHGATDSDLEKIAALNLASVFDLRTSKERGHQPCRRPEGFAARIHLSEDRVVTKTAAAPHIAAAQTARERTPESSREAMCKNYTGIPFRPELQQMIRLQMVELAGGGASLVNCMAGKDRTGMAVAAIQLAAGVHRDDVVEDYLLTNTAGDVEARIQAGIATVLSATGRVQDEASLRILMGVEPEYLEAAFSAIAEKHGSIDGYLREELGADDALRERLRGALVE